MVDRAVTLVESTSPNSLLLASLDAARRQAAVHGHELLDEAIHALAATRAAVREVPGLDVLDERMAGAPGVHDYDPLRLAIDVRGTGATGYELAPMLRELADINLELAGENVLVGVFGMGSTRRRRARGSWRPCAEPWRRSTPSVATARASRSRRRRRGASWRWGRARRSSARRRWCRRPRRSGG